MLKKLVKYWKNHTKKGKEACEKCNQLFSFHAFKKLELISRDSPF